MIFFVTKFIAIFSYYVIIVLLSSEENIMIKLCNVSKIYNNSGVLTTGLHNVSLELNRGEIVAITGESGSGKSTLLGVLTKMDTFDEGEYYYKGNETSYFDVDDMDNFRKNKVGFIFQNYNIIDSYSVLENVMLPLKINGLSGKQARARAMELIEKVGLKSRYKNKGSQLSGGEKQRCVIARALAADCDILACDEPTGNLDSKTGMEIIKLIKEVADNKLVLIVTHSYEQVQDIVTRKIKVHNGEIAEDIVYKKVEPEPEENLDLDYVPLQNKIRVGIAANNLKNTPKKTILTSIIILFVTIFTLCLYQSIFYTIYNERYINSFYYRGDNKLIVYNVNDDKLIDIDEIKKHSDDYIVNSFYDTITYYVRIDDDYQYDDYQYLGNVGYEKHPENLKLDGGKMPTEPFECVILISDKYLDGKKLLDKKFRLQVNTNLDESYKYKIVGYQYRSDISTNVITACDEFEMQLRIENFISSVNMRLYFGDNDSPLSGIRTKYNLNLEKSKIQFDFNLLPADSTEEQKQAFLESCHLSEFIYSGYNLGITLSDFECESASLGVPYTMILGRDIIDLIERNPYEVTVYLKNASEKVSTFERMGYVCASVKNFSNESAIEHLVMNLWAYISIFFSSLSLIIIYFITYVILTKVYGSKKKDYTILRTLGVSRRDMKSVVTAEIMIPMTAISVITFVSALIIRCFLHSGFFKIFSRITLTTSIIYFVAMLLFGFLLSRRFNSRLFKFSVNKTLKQGESRND